MTQQQTSCVSVASHQRRLRRRTMTILHSLLLILRSIRRLVIDARCALKLLMQFGQIASVATVSVTARRVGRACQSTARYHVAIFVGPRRAVLYVVYLRHGDMVEVYHVAAYMRQRRLLAEEETGARLTMLQRNRLDSQTAILVDDSTLLRIDGMKLYLVVEIVAECLQQHVEHRLQFFRRIDSKRHGASEQAERREHTDESEAMVAVNMTDEHSAKTVEAYLRTAHLQLSALTAIDEKLLLAYLHHLRRRIMAQRGQRTAATKYMYLEWFHSFTLSPLVFLTSFV